MAHLGGYTPEYVVVALEEAGQTLLSLRIRGARPAGYRSNMPEVVREGAEYAQTEARLTAPLPDAKAISRMDQVLGWIRLVPQEKAVIRRIVGLRCLVKPLTGQSVYSWSKIGRLLGCDYRAAQRWHAEGIATIVGRLNAPGLCARTNGQVEPSPRLVEQALARIKAEEPAPRKRVSALEFI